MRHDSSTPGDYFLYIISVHSNSHIYKTPLAITVQLLTKVINILFSFITARQTKLWEGNGFTAVCLSTVVGSEYSCSRVGTHPQQVLTPWIHVPGMLRDTVGKRVVSILLECFLVSNIVSFTDTNLFTRKSQSIS